LLFNKDNRLTFMKGKKLGSIHTPQPSLFCCLFSCWHPSYPARFSTLSGPEAP
jgi:hypothetical protein